MLTKTKLIEHIEDFPEEFSIDELVDKLVLISKIENGNSQSKNKLTITEDDLNEEIEKWFE